MDRFLHNDGAPAPAAGPGPARDEQVYKFDGVVYRTIEELQRRLLEYKAASRASYWRNLDVVIVDSNGAQAVKLKCLLCGENLTYTNPAQTGRSHFGEEGKIGGCKQLRNAAAVHASSGLLWHRHHAARADTP